MSLVGRVLLKARKGIARVLIGRALLLWEVMVWL